MPRYDKVPDIKTVIIIVGTRYIIKEKKCKNPLKISSNFLNITVLKAFPALFKRIKLSAAINPNTISNIDPLNKTANTIYAINKSKPDLYKEDIIAENNFLLLESGIK